MEDAGGELKLFLRRVLCGRLRRQWLGGTHDTQGKAKIRTPKEAGRDARGGVRDIPLDLFLFGGVCGNVYPHWRRAPDGRTAWELRHGRPFKRELVHVAEKMLHLFGGNAKVQFEEKFR